MMTDPIADKLTRSRNAVAIERASVSMPYTRLKADIAAVLKEEGFIEELKVTGETPAEKQLHVYLKYGSDGEFLITEIKRQSRPGCRRYMNLDDLHHTRVRDGFGIAILTTPKGVMSDRKCRAERVGGELICTVY